MTTEAVQQLNTIPHLQEKLEYLQRRLGAPDLASALDKSLEIANYFTETIENPSRKLLVEEDGKFREVTGIE